MRLRAVLFAGPAERQRDDTGEDNEEYSGPAARERYETLAIQGLEDLLDNPARPGIRQVAGHLLHQLRHSRNWGPGE